MPKKTTGSPVKDWLGQSDRREAVGKTSNEADTRPPGTPPAHHDPDAPGEYVDDTTSPEVPEPNEPA